MSPRRLRAAAVAMSRRAPAPASAATADEGMSKGANDSPASHVASTNRPASSRRRPAPVTTGDSSALEVPVEISPHLSTLSANLAGSSIISPHNQSSSQLRDLGMRTRAMGATNSLVEPNQASPSPGKRKFTMSTVSTASTVPAEEPAVEAAMRPPPPRAATRSEQRNCCDRSAADAGSAESLARSESPTKKLRARALPVTVEALFRPGMLGSRVFRIPSLLALPGGVLLALCEGRQDWHDAGTIDIVMRRSEDDGLTWGPITVLMTGSMLSLPYAATVGNPTLVWDRFTHKVTLLMCSNHAEDAEWAIHAAQSVDTRRVFVAESSDLGISWTKPREITKAVKPKGWTWYATGPGIGVQLRTGRLLVPCNHAEDVVEKRYPYLPQIQRSRMVAHCIYSDDHGATWQLGGVATNHTNESALAELASGRVVMNARDWSGNFRRVIQSSKDGGSSWQAAKFDSTLVEPRPQGCQGSLVALPRDRQNGRGLSSPAAKDTIFFCNPASLERRERLTVQRSDDGGKTWSRQFVLERGASAYSCLGLLGGGRLGVLFEREDHIAFASLSSAADGPLGAF